MKDKIIALIVVLLCCAIAFVFLVIDISQQSTKPKIKCHLANPTGKWERISWYLPYIIKQDNGTAQVIELNAEEFINRINHKIETKDLIDGFVHVHTNSACGLNFPEPNRELIIESISIHETSNNVMWFSEKTTIPILQENGGYILKTVNLTLYHAYGVIPQK